MYAIIESCGKQYKYYKINLGSISYSSSNNITKKPSASGSNVWWLRSPHSGLSSGYFCYVDYEGFCNTSYGSYSKGVAPGFSI